MFDSVFRKAKKMLDENHTRKVKEKAVYDATYSAAFEEMRKRKITDDAMAKAYKKAYAPTIQEKIGRMVNNTAREAADNYRKRAAELKRDSREYRKKEKLYGDF